MKLFGRVRGIWMIIDLISYVEHFYVTMMDNAVNGFLISKKAIFGILSIFFYIFFYTNGEGDRR